ncbi:MAG TPA: hypothetical protein VJ912_00890 [Candidatus Nanoarchaeia archaeon]|nr:hypothetical protein [Candidatus Nanoarchaeia archaeon]
MEKGYHIKHPQLNRKESLKLVKILVDNDKKQRGVVRIVKDGKICKEINRIYSNNKIGYYNIKTGKELTNYENSE